MPYIGYICLYIIYIVCNSISVLFKPTTSEHVKPRTVVVRSIIWSKTIYFAYDFPFLSTLPPSSDLAENCRQPPLPRHSPKSASLLSHRTATSPKHQWTEVQEKPPSLLASAAVDLRNSRTRSEDNQGNCPR
jgi:hypothetical protein